MTGTGIRRRRRLRGETGYILVMTGLLLIPLLVFTAFSVDLGAWYAQASREQRAVDAASLAGVVQLPTTGSAVSAAETTLAANGFPCTLVAVTPGTVATSGQPCVYALPTELGQEMTISIYHSAPQYFSEIVLNGESLTRTATAVYNLHIPLGSPNNVFGNNMPAGCTFTYPLPACDDSTPQPLTWAAINGPYSNHQDGDPFATKCSGANGGTPTSCSATSRGPNLTGAPIDGGVNTTYDSDGYEWVVQVPASDAGSSVTVSIYDPAFDGDSNSIGEAYSGSGSCQSNCLSTWGFSTSYQLFNTSGSNASISFDQSQGMNSQTNGPAGGTGGLNDCIGSTLGYKVFAPGTASQNAWYALCTFDVPSTFEGGGYGLQVKTSAIPGVTDTGTGYNVYAVKATTSGGAAPQVSGYQSLSVWNYLGKTAVTGTASFYLAFIGPQYAGHTLDLDLFDPGDGTGGNYFMQFFAPPSGLTTVPGTGTPTSCLYSDPTLTQGGAVTNSSSNCQIQTRDSGTSTPNIYNDNWMRVQITIPVSYSCTSDCWWTVQYSFQAGTPTDRTVWEASVLGNPVHLVS